MTHISSDCPSSTSPHDFEEDNIADKIFAFKYSGQTNKIIIGLNKTKILTILVKA